MTTFEDFWSLYPRRVAKRAALKEWEREIRAGTDPSEIIDGLQRQLPSLRGKEPQFIPHARTWLHQGRWEDEIEDRRSPGNRKRTIVDAARDRINELYGHHGNHADAQRLPDEQGRPGSDAGHVRNGYVGPLVPSRH